MTMLESPLRFADESDAFVLAELVNYAGDGLPLELWRTLAGPQGDPWALGRTRHGERAARGQWVVVDEGTVVAALEGYPTPVSDDFDGHDVPSILEPMIALRAKVPNHFFIDNLAAYPRARGRGLGARLVRYAESVAAEQGLDGVAIALADQNHGALRLYDRLGYREEARVEMEKGGWESPSTHWVLLVKKAKK